MDVIHSASNWKLTIRRETDHIVILRAVTCDRRAVLPDTIFDLPVTVLGDRALAPTAAPVEGEQIRLVCGPEEDWDNRALEDLTLPAHLNEVENYAFYGCRSLHTLRLHDRVNRWGGYCFMNCRGLRNFHLTRVGEKQGEALAFLCGEVHEELNVTIYQVGGAILRLIFPDFAEEYEENCPNHHFDYHIFGGGYAYHHAFRSKQLHMQVYDSLWDKYLREEHDPETALHLAYNRLRWPVDLKEAAAEGYRSYLRRNGAEALRWQLSLRDGTGLRLLLDALQPDGELLHFACAQARANGDTESLALLLEKQHRTQPAGLDKDFDL